LQTLESSGQMKKDANRNRIIVLFIAGTAFFGWHIFSTIGDGGLSEKDKRLIEANGLKCIAFLRAVERTGSTVNNIHQYQFLFDVKPDSGDAFTYQEKKLIDPIYMDRIEIGMAVPAYVMPGNQSKVWVLWEDVGIKNAF